MEINEQTNNNGGIKSNSNVKILLKAHGTPLLLRRLANRTNRMFFCPSSTQNNVVGAKKYNFPSMESIIITRRFRYGKRDCY